MRAKVFNYLVALGVIYTALRILNLPLLYPIYFWLLDYDAAIIPRGLPGQLLHWIAPDEKSTSLLWIIILLSFAVLGTLLYLYYRALRYIFIRSGGAGSPLFWPLLALATSPFTFYATHCVGYFDNLLAIVAMSSIWLIYRKPESRLITAPLLSIIGVMIHENYLLFGLPAVLFALIAFEYKTPARTHSWRFTGIAISAGCALLTYALLHVATHNLSAADILSIRQHVAEKAILSTSRDAILLTSGGDILKNTLSDNLQRTRDIYAMRIAFIYRDNKWLWLGEEGLYAVLPTLIVLYGSIRISQKHRRLPDSLTALACAATLAPVGICIVAWDMSRFFSMMPYNGLLCLYALSKLDQPIEIPKTKFEKALPIFSMLALCTNLYIHPKLLDLARPLHNPLLSTLQRDLLKQAGELALFVPAAKN